MVHQTSGIAKLAAFQYAPRGLPPSSAHNINDQFLHPAFLAPLREASPLSRVFDDGIISARRRSWLQAKKTGKEVNGEEDVEIPDVERAEAEFIKEDLARVESLEEILEELEAIGAVEEDDNEDFFLDEWDDSLDELFQSIPDEDEDDDDDETYLDVSRQKQSASLLETALLQGVVAPDAGVGSNSLPGDFNFDPLDMASKDYFPKAQAFVGKIIPGGDEEDVEAGPRPKALILRDYREAEIRHGRLAMLAATFWPLQELLDKLILDEDNCTSLLNALFFGGVTLPYFPLLMTAIMLLLGYLDIYSQAIKDVDKLGDAFLPGDCFWDPLQILGGAPDAMKRNMQERELFNGRFAMLAVAMFVYEEAFTGLPIVSIPGNEILFEPAYQVPFVQYWLDDRFSTPSPVFYRFTEDAAVTDEVIDQAVNQLSEGDLASAITTVDFVLSQISDSIMLSI